MRRCCRRRGWATPALTCSAGVGRIWSAGAADLAPATQLLDTYSPEIFCAIRNFHDVQPKIHAVVGARNGYSLGTASAGGIVGALNSYIYSDNLPRVNARGGPGRAPGCWQMALHAA